MDLIFNVKLFSLQRTIAIRWQWIQFAIIALAVVSSTLVAYWGSPLIFALILVLMVGVGVVIALMRQPNVGFILILLGGMFVPITGPSGLSMATVMVALMLGLWIMDMFIVRKYFALIRSRVMLPLITFLMIAILAFGMGQIPWFVFARQAPLTAQVAGFAIVVFSVGAMLLAAHLIQDVRWLRNIVWIFLGLVSFYILGRALHISPLERIFNHGFVAQSMSWTWLVALAFSQIVYNDQLSRRGKWMLIALVVLMFYVAIVQGFEWKSGWVPPLLTVFILLGIRYRNLVVFTIPFVAMIGIYLAFNLIASDEYSWGTRNDAWRIILEISRVSPLLGMGFSNYYWYTPLFPIRGWHVSFNSHSQYVDLIAQMGYLGFLGFIWLFATVGKLSWDLAARFRSGFERAYAYGVLAGVISTMVAAYLGDWVLPFVYNVGLPGFRASVLPWIFMGGLISLEQMLVHNAHKNNVQ